MILSALRLFRSLSRYHYRVIIVTILLPVIWPPMIAYFGPDCLILQVILYVAAIPRMVGDCGAGRGLDVE